MNGCYTRCPTCALLFNVIKAALQTFNKTAGSANIHILLKTSTKHTTLWRKLVTHLYTSTL